MTPLSPRPGSISPKNLSESPSRAPLRPEAYTLTSLGQAFNPHSKLYILQVLSNENHGRYPECVQAVCKAMEWMARVARQKDTDRLTPPPFTPLEERVLQGLQEDPTFRKQIRQLPFVSAIFELYGNRPCVQKEDLAYMRLALMRPREIKRRERREYRKLVREKKASLPTQAVTNILSNPSHPYYSVILERLRYISYAQKKQRENPTFSPSYVKLDYDLLGVGAVDISPELREEIQELRTIAEKTFSTLGSRHQKDYFAYALAEGLSEDLKATYREKVEAGIALSPQQCIEQAIFSPNHCFHNEMLERLIYRQYVKEKQEEDPCFSPSFVELDRDLDSLLENLSPESTRRLQQLSLCAKERFSLLESRHRLAYFDYALHSSPCERKIARYEEKVEAGIAPSPRQSILQALSDEEHPFQEAVIQCLQNKHGESILSKDLKVFLEEPDFCQDVFYKFFLHPTFYEDDPVLKQEMHQFLIDALTHPSHLLHSLCVKCLESVVETLKGEDEKENDPFALFDRDQPIPSLLRYFLENDPTFSSELKSKRVL